MTATVPATGPAPVGQTVAPEAPAATPVVDDAALASGWLATRATRFDAFANRRLDRIRGPVADRVFYTASQVGDFSLIWHAVGSWRAVLRGDDLTGAVRFSAAVGVESLLVNQVVKRAFDRGRPAWEHRRPHRLRRPSTSSFPSGHASSAFFAATLLSARDPWLTPVYATAATVVALSRAYVRVHHPTDVLAGAALGLALGRVALAVDRRR